MLKVQMPLMKYDTSMLAYWAAHQEIIHIAKFKLSVMEDAVYIQPQFPDEVIDKKATTEALELSLRMYAQKIHHVFVRPVPTVADLAPLQLRRSTDNA